MTSDRGCDAIVAENRRRGRRRHLADDFAPERDYERKHEAARNLFVTKNVLLL